MIGTPTPPISVALYHGLIDAGILGENDPYELHFGKLVAKMPKNYAHTLATRFFREALKKLAGANHLVDSQEPLVFAESEPEPDVFVLRGPESAYLAGKPLATDVLLIVEVAESSLDYDRAVKQAIYSDAGVPEYWIVNLIDRQLEVYTLPQVGAGVSAAYGHCEVVPFAGSLPVALGNNVAGTIELSDLKV